MKAVIPLVVLVLGAAIIPGGIALLVAMAIGLFAWGHVAKDPRRKTMAVAIAAAGIILVPLLQGSFTGQSQASPILAAPATSNASPGLGGPLGSSATTPVGQSASIATPNGIAPTAAATNTPGLLQTAPASVPPSITGGGAPPPPSPALIYVPPAPSATRPGAVDLTHAGVSGAPSAPRKDRP